MYSVRVTKHLVEYRGGITWHVEKKHFLFPIWMFESSHYENGELAAYEEAKNIYAKRFDNLFGYFSVPTAFCFCLGFLVFSIYMCKISNQCH